MEVTKVKEAARLLEKYEKLGELLDSVKYADPSHFTLTFKKNAGTKSVTIQNNIDDFNAVEFVKSLRETTLIKMRELGVDV